MRRTVEEGIDGRSLVPTKDIIECIRIETGRTIGRNIFPAWRAMKMPGAVQPPGQRIWLYDWEAVWGWYLTYSALRRARRRIVEKGDED